MIFIWPKAIINTSCDLLKPFSKHWQEVIKAARRLLRAERRGEHVLARETLLMLLRRVISRSRMSAALLFLVAVYSWIIHDAWEKKMSLESQINSTGGRRWYERGIKTGGTEGDRITCFCLLRCCFVFCFLLFFFSWQCLLWKKNGLCVLKTPHRSHREWALYMRNVCLHKHHLALLIKPQGGLVTHLLPHPQDAHLSLIWKPRINQEDITKLLVIFKHFEMEYKCLFKSTFLLVWVDLGVFLFWKQPVCWDLRMNLHMWVWRWESAREANCYLFVCLLMENKPGEMKCFAWKIDFSLPGNKLSVPHWPFDLLC